MMKIDRKASAGARSLGGDNFYAVNNHSPMKSDIDSPDQPNGFKRPPLPSIHQTSQKYINTGRTYEFLKRNLEKKVIHDRHTLLQGQENAHDVNKGDWKSLIMD